MNYNYTIKIDLAKDERNSFKAYLWTKYGMKPTMRFRNDMATVICHAYSIEEKSKNKNMLHEAITNFRSYQFGKTA